MELKNKPEGKVKVKVSMSAVVTRGDSGIHGPPGSVENLGEQSREIVELDFDSLSSIVGEDEAVRIFNSKETPDG